MLSSCQAGRITLGSHPQNRPKASQREEQRRGELGASRNGRASQPGEQIGCPQVPHSCPKVDQHAGLFGAEPVQGKKATAPPEAPLAPRATAAPTWADSSFTAGLSEVTGSGCGQACAPSLGARGLCSRPSVSASRPTLRRPGGCSVSWTAPKIPAGQPGRGGQAPEAPATGCTRWPRPNGGLVLRPPKWSDVHQGRDRSERSVGRLLRPGRTCSQKESESCPWTQTARE